MTQTFDLIIIGAGSAGLTAAKFAAQLNLKAALIEKKRLGGDCTWTGCIPSKALLKAAKVAHYARRAEAFGISSGPIETNMPAVRDYIQGRIEAVYQRETPDVLAGQGVEVIFGPARFVEPHTLQVENQTLRAKKFIIATGARPVIPAIPGLKDVPYHTHQTIFANDRLPQRLGVIGAGPVGVEIAQAYQRLGAQVTLIDVDILPGEDAETRETIKQVLACEGLQFVPGLVSEIRQSQSEIILTVNETDYPCDMLLLAVGRKPNVQGLGLENIGFVKLTDGLEVDANLRAAHKHIYAAGDCIKGNAQFTSYAGWQGYLAVRNAFLPGKSAGHSNLIPRVIFTDPETAQIGLSESEARERHGPGVEIRRLSLDKVDRAVSDNAGPGFIRIAHHNGQILGATIVAEQAGEMITEIALAMKHKLSLADLASVLHPYPTYSMGLMQLAADVATAQFLNSSTGKLAKYLMNWFT